MRVNGLSAARSGTGLALTRTEFFGAGLNI